MQIQSATMGTVDKLQNKAMLSLHFYTPRIPD